MKKRKKEDETSMRTLNVKKYKMLKSMTGVQFRKK
jgi:hypothetical protein